MKTVDDVARGEPCGEPPGHWQAVQVNRQLYGHRLELPDLHDRRRIRIDQKGERREIYFASASKTLPQLDGGIPVWQPVRPARSGGQSVVDPAEDSVLGHTLRPRIDACVRRRQLRDGAELVRTPLSTRTEVRHEVGDDHAILLQRHFAGLHAAAMPQRLRMELARTGLGGFQITDGCDHRVVSLHLFAESAQHCRKDVTAVGFAKRRVPAVGQGQVTDSVATRHGGRVDGVIVVAHSPILHGSIGALSGNLVV